MKRSWKPAIAGLVAAGALIAVSNTHAVETSNNIYQASEEYRVGAFSSVPQIDLNCKALHPELDSFDVVGKCMDHNWRKVLGTPVPEEELRKRLTNSTTISYSPEHGTQASFNAPDGTNYLWYPGIPQIVKGEWKITNENEVFAAGVDSDANTPSDFVCFRYPASELKPLTNVVGDVWTCGRGGEILWLQDQLVLEGDVLGLEGKTQAPFITKPHLGYTVGELKQEQ
ncbi:MAG: hypothetical protein AAGF54_03815 [Pseudomonadota bacterium]